ncbi:MAG: PEP-CTERM sorting domain-containing protein [Candidatus Accumulibacter sp.]|jgi:hypothetical protein|uniref:PEP-CTERM sorting domain-containing protein n=1 Tax=Accumulibacter sp. TaxID=2053492 RepID=UPI00258F98CE|nr:PEP-CTERM sorting domain-containing protein [Accumulibacter sp.]MBK8117733.1 PEP-CTERM sorting domain-containing protein [Accumulibacter sp.]
MNYKPIWLAAVIALLLPHATSRAEILFQSALPGGYGSDSGSTIGGYSGSGQILGAAFSLSQAVHVDSIGGLFFSSPSNGADDIFGAIVQLGSSTALPSGDPFAVNKVLGTVVFHVGSSTAVDVFAPLSLNLPAGDYAVVFGSGYFGSIGIAGAPAGGGGLSARYLYWGDSFGPTSWHEGGHTSERFIVTGTVPEPASVALLLVGAALCLSRRSLRTHQRSVLPRKSIRMA